MPDDGTAPAPSIRFRSSLGTPLGQNAAKLLLLGSGEIGREVAIEAIRLGAEVIAVDRYANAPAMHVAHRSHVVAMTDGRALRAVIEREQPDVIVPEIEQIDTTELVRLQEDGYAVVPNAAATRITMNRERIRRLAAETGHVRTSRYLLADSVDDARKAAREIGYPCFVKALVSSSGHGMTQVRSARGIERAYREATRHGRVPNRRVMIEESIDFDTEVTLLTVRHYRPNGKPGTTVLAPVGHARPSTVYHESWQPMGFPARVVHGLGDVARKVTGLLGGFGVFGVECFVKGENVYFSEVSPRPHDTGLVTLGSQWNSEFALHARAVLGLPYQGPEPVVPAAAHVILGSAVGWSPTLGGLDRALAERGVRVFLFGKPEAYPDRRLGVTVARGRTIAEARRTAARAAHAIEAAIAFPPRRAAVRA
ncbi:MAG: formate-dependent phosphoribosylglycinamide formyltransferase [Thermoplasmata archaeon]|nr:formate-dependent phosphoribosylglycinamide formyltransferase [Thermoplasmata archaeon]